MCRIEERVYIGTDGHRSMFEESFPCDKSRNGKLCSKVKKKTLEYHRKSGSLSRDNTPSPGNPPTPTGTGAYVIQHIRPSSNSGRPSTRDGHKSAAPEITINFNSKKDNGKRYSGITVSAKPQKRSSLTVNPLESSDLIEDFIGLDGSHPIRTGFPDAPLPTPTTFGHPNSYMPPPSHSYHHRQTSSTSSFNLPSQAPSLYGTSDLDYESPDSRRGTRQPLNIIQHQTPTMSPSSTSRASAMKAPPPYHTSVATPRAPGYDAHLPDNLYPLDHGELADRSASSYASSGAPENTRKSKDHDERHRKQEEQRRREDEWDRRIAEEAARENAKQVRFKLERPAAREREKAETAYAEKEKDRAQAREDARRRERKEREKKDREAREAEEKQRKKEREAEEKQRKKQEREDEEARQRLRVEREAEEEARRRKKETLRSPTIKQEVKPVPRTRKASMTQDQIAEQRLLLAAEQRHMEDEKQAAILREREEHNALLRQQQETREYFDPRGGDRSLGRRGSISQQSPMMPSPSLTRSGSHRRSSIHQANLPNVNTQIAQDYSTRPPAIRQKTGPPVSYFNQTQGSNRPPSTRRPSFAQDTAPPSARIRRDSGSSIANAFVQDRPVLSPSLSSSDPWDIRNVQAALPTGRPNRETRSNTMEQRGQEVINRSVSKAQQATQAMYQNASVFDDDDDDDDSEDGYDAYAVSPRRRKP
ncbi:hypothetical protein NX059_004405 [Plenodomus lindquistii]|nr:hypothetical protein NX059_004405 [Plenodomus lindquistii]